MKVIFLDKIFPIFFALTFIVCGAFMLIKGIQEEKYDTVTVTAVLCGYEAVENEDIENNTVSYTYSPVFEYSYDGRDYKNTSSVGYSEKKYEVGEEVKLQINPQSPESFHIKGDNTVMTLGIVFAAVGALFVIYTVFAEKIRRKIFGCKDDAEVDENEADKKD